MNTPLVKMPPVNWTAIAYDPTANVIVALGNSHTGFGTPVVYTWDGTTFTELTMTGTGPGPGTRAIALAPYPPANKLVAVGLSTAYYLDVIDRSWTTIPGGGSRT